MTLPSQQTRPTFTRAVLWSALVAGGLFLVLVIVLPALFQGQEVLGPPRMIGGLVMHSNPATMSTGLIVAGVVGHFVLSVLFTFILALFIGRMGTRTAIAAGAVYGLILYLVNFYVMAVAFPWFADFRSTTAVVSHLAFGLTAAWLYKRLRTPKPRSVS